MARPKSRLENWYFNIETKKNVPTKDFSTSLDKESSASSYPQNHSKSQQISSTSVEDMDPYKYNSYGLMEIEGVHNTLRNVRDDSCGTPDVEINGFTEVSVKEVRYPKNSTVVIFDTSALMRTPDIIRRSAEAEIYMRIPYTVICELDKLKHQNHKNINTILKDIIAEHAKSLLRKYPIVTIENSADRSLPHYEQSEYSSESTYFVTRCPDDTVLKTALMLRKYTNGFSVKLILVTGDLNMHTKAIAHRLKCMDDKTFVRDYIVDHFNCQTAKRYPSYSHRDSDHHHAPKPSLYDDRDHLYRCDGKLAVPEKKHLSKDLSPGKYQRLYVQDDLQQLPVGSSSSRKCFSVHYPTKPSIMSHYYEEQARKMVSSTTDSEKSLNKLCSTLVSKVKSPRFQTSAIKKLIPVSTQMDNNNPNRPITSWYDPERFTVFWFSCEVQKFQYLLRAAVEKTLYLIQEESQFELKERLDFLCAVTYSFVVGNYQEGEFISLLDQIEELYSITIKRLSNSQKIDRQKLAAELQAAGPKGEGLEYLRLFAENYHSQWNWVPPTVPVIPIPTH